MWMLLVSVQYLLISLQMNEDTDEMFSILIFDSDGNIFVWMESNLVFYFYGVFILKLWIFRKPLPVVKYTKLWSVTEYLKGTSLNC